MEMKTAPLPLLTKGHAEVLGYMDKYFGAYTMGMIALALFGWSQGAVSWKTPASLAAFVAVNLSFSQITLRVSDPRRARRLEVFRFLAINGALSSLVLLASDGALAGWWVSFVVVIVGIPTLMGLFHNSPGLGRALAVSMSLYYMALSFFAADQPNPYQIGTQGGLMLMLSLFSAQVMVALGRSLKVESEEKAKIVQLHEQLDQQRVQSMHGAQLSALGSMAGGIAHELNTPLAVIRMNAEQLQELAAEQAIDRSLLLNRVQVLSETAVRMARIIQGLRSFSRQAGDDPVQEVKLGQLVDDTLLLCREKFRESGVKLELKQSVESPVVRCRPTQASQAILNLLSNAFDAALEGEGARWVRVEVRQAAGQGQIVVADGGPGMSEGVRAKLFQPFFTTKEIGKGTGLGLSVAKGLMEAQGGGVTFEPVPGETRFVVSLPAAGSAA